MIELGILVVGAIIGFVTGVLVYRNNAELLNEKVAELEATKDELVEDYEIVKAELEALKAKLKK